LRHTVRVFQLAEDLRFAEDHGIEPRRDAERVCYGVLFLVNIQAGGQVECIAMVPLEPLRQFSTAGGAGPIHLGAVAGGQNDNFRHPQFLSQGAQSGKQSVFAERYLFAQSDRCGLVIDAEDVECH
jgi:hypothetical protein